MTKEDKYFIAWIKSQPCYFGGKFLEHSKYPYFCEQDWDEVRGEFASDPSHIMKRGSTRRDEHQGNLFPNCRRHHIWFEQLTPLERSKFKDVGNYYWEAYLESKNME